MTGPRLPDPGRALCIAAGLWIVLGAQQASAQEAGSTRFDVPYVPTPQVTVDEMLRLAKVGPQDVVLDLGSGDGRIVITAAAKYGARGMGVDLDDDLLGEAEESARQAGVAERVRFLQQDLFKTDLAQASVITMYLLPGVVKRLRPRLLELKPGTRIVSHDFDLEDWRPDHKTTIRKNVFLWVVPARVAGRWRARLELSPIDRLVEFTITQRFQEISAHGRLNGVPTPVWEARLEGDRISFVVVDTTDREDEASLYFEGRISGDVMAGELTRGVGRSRNVSRWRAVRVGN